MHIEYYGSEYDLLDGAFYDSEDDEFDVDLLSATSTRIILRSVETGYFTTLIGSGLVAADTIGDMRGTLSSIEFRDVSGGLIAIVSGISWTLAELIGALDDVYEFGDVGALMTLLDRSGGITVDASAAIQEGLLYLRNVSVPVTYLGSDQVDNIYSGAGDDTLSGGSGGDRFYSSEGDDLLYGGAGNDTLSGGPGNDTIDGGAGWDVLYFDQSSSTDAVMVDLEAGTARGGWGGSAFTQTISNIEAVIGTRDFGDLLSGSGAGETFFGDGGNDAIFGDGFDAAYAMAEAATVYRLYQATLDRAPDLRGFTGWTEKLQTGQSTLLQVTNGFVASQEFQSTYGALDNEGFVTLLYNNVLDRDPDATGLSGWVGKLEGGMSHAQVVMGFAQSGEFVTQTAAAAASFAQTHSQAMWSDDVYRLYQATLDRAPDLGGFTGWTEKLAGSTSLLSAIDGFVNSTEFQNTYGPLDNEGFVDLLYQNVLGRAADAGGLSGWVAKLEGGTSRAEVVMGFSQSSEFAAATADDLKTWIRGLDLGTGVPFHDWVNGADGDNLLAGGLFDDVFVFEQGNGGDHQVLDLEAWDYIAFGGFGYGTSSEAHSHMSQSGSDVLFEDQAVSITFVGTRLGQITEDMIIV